MLNVTFDSALRVFHLTNGAVSYVMRLYHEGYLAHLYYGKALPEPVNVETFFYETEREGAPQPHGRPHSGRATRPSGGTSPQARQGLHARCS